MQLKEVKGMGVCSSKGTPEGKKPDAVTITFPASPPRQAHSAPPPGGIAPSPVREVQTPPPPSAATAEAAPSVAHESAPSPEAGASGKARRKSAKPTADASPANPGETPEAGTGSKARRKSAPNAAAAAGAKARRESKKPVSFDAVLPPDGSQATPEAPRDLAGSGSTRRKSAPNTAEGAKARRKSKPAVLAAGADASPSAHDASLAAPEATPGSATKAVPRRESAPNAAAVARRKSKPAALDGEPAAPAEPAAPEDVDAAAALAATERAKARRKPKPSVKAAKAERAAKPAAPAAPVNKVASAAAQRRFGRLYGEKDGCSIGSAAERGITLPQLTTLLSVAAEACRAEKWQAEGASAQALTPEALTVRDVLRLVLPEVTEGGKRSLVEVMAQGPQPPSWYVCHWHEEPCADLLACLLQHSKDRNLADDQSYWISAFALRGAEQLAPLQSAPFRTALLRSHGTVCLLGRKAALLSRAWCSLELALTLGVAPLGEVAGKAAPAGVSALAGARSAERLLDFYAPANAQKQGMAAAATDAEPVTVGALGPLPRAVGLVDGLAAGDGGDMSAKAARESAFPPKLAQRVLGCSVRESAFNLQFLGAELAGKEDAFDQTVRAALGLAMLPSLANPSSATHELLGAYLSALQASRLRKAFLCVGAPPALPDGGDGGAARQASADRLEQQVGSALPSCLEVLDARGLRGDSLVPSIGRLLSLRQATLTNLELTGCALSADGLAALASAVGTSRSLVSLALRANGPVPPQASKALADSLRVNKSVTALDLGGSELGLPGAEALAQALRNGSCPVEELLLSGARLGDEGSALVCESLRKNYKVCLVNLASNGLCVRALDALAPVLAAKRCALLELILSANQIGLGGVQALSSALATNTSLELLDIASNPLGDAGVAALAAALAANTTLIELTLSAAQFGDVGAAALGRAFGAKSAIRSLDVSHNGIGDRGAEALANGLETNISLLSIDLRSTAVGDDGAVAIVEALEANVLDLPDGTRIKRRIALAQSQITSELTNKLNSSVHV